MGFHFEKLTVLVVEDTREMQKLVVSVLGIFGFKNINTASSMSEAFKLFQKENQDIILTNWEMESGSGIELTREIRTDPISPNRMVPIIMMTGYNSLHRIKQARDSGITEFLMKPFTAEDFARRISHVINSPRDFIETKDFFGPDRRRRMSVDYSGPRRREADQKSYNANTVRT